MTRARNIAGFSTITTTPSPVNVGPIGVLTAVRIDGEFNQVDLATRNITAAGIAATNLQVSGITTGLNVSGIITAQNGINFNGTSTGLNVSGVGTIATLSVTGNATIAGVLTYEDVTRVDSVGVVTARGLSIFGNTTGLQVASGISTFSDVSARNITGVAVTFTGALSGTTGTFSSHVSLGDSDELRLGAGSDLRLYHTGTNSYVRNLTGDLYIQTNDGSGNAENGIAIKPNAAVELYHNNSKKLDTDSEGISVTGTVKINNTSSVGDYNGGADDMLIGTHSGNHGLTILSGTSNGGYIMFSDNNGGGTNAYRGQIEYAHSSDYMRFITDSGERVRILSGGGITFNGDTATANALDDYEEGSFTPAFGGGISASSYHNQYGFYTKTGDQVYAYIYLRANSASTGSANVTVTGLPYTCNGAAGYEGGGYFTYLNGFFGTAVDNEHFHPMPWVSLGNTYAVFHTPADGNNITGSDTVPGNKYCIFHLRYRAA